MESNRLSSAVSNCDFLTSHLHPIPGFFLSLISTGAKFGVIFSLSQHCYFQLFIIIAKELMMMILFDYFLIRGPSTFVLIGAWSAQALDALY